MVRGDSFGTLARRFGKSGDAWRELAEFNGIKIHEAREAKAATDTEWGHSANPAYALLVVGQVLNLPDGWELVEATGLVPPKAG